MIEICLVQAIVALNQLIIVVCSADATCFDDVSFFVVCGYFGMSF